MVFRHTPLLFPPLSSLSKLLHSTVKHLVLACDTATQHPLKFKLRKTKTLTSDLVKKTLDVGQSVTSGYAALRPLIDDESQTISRPTQIMPLNIFAITLSQGLVKLR